MTTLSIRLGLALAGLTAASATHAAGIRIVTLDETRAGTVANEHGGFNFNFATSSGYAGARQSLQDAYTQDPANPATISTVPNLQDVNRANADVIVLPLLTNGPALSTTEADSVRDFLNNGGGLIAFSNTTPIDSFYQQLFGVSGTTFPLTDPNPVSIAAPKSPIIHGPFGSIASDAAIQAWHGGRFSGLGTGTALLNRGDGSALAASFQVGQGRAVLFADEEMFIDSASQVADLVHGTFQANSNNQLLLKNAFAFVQPVPEPGPLLVLLLGMGGAYSRYRGRKRPINT